MYTVYRVSEGFRRRNVHNNVRLAAADGPENGLKIVATPKLALSETKIIFNFT